MMSCKTLPKYFGICRILAMSLIVPVAAVPNTLFAQTSSQGQSISQFVNVPAANLRLEKIGFRISQANADRCEYPELLSGLMLHDLSGFSAADRASARSFYGLTYGFGIKYVVEGSIAERAGLAIGDEILAVNGNDLAHFSRAANRRDASYERTDAFLTFLDSALRSGTANLSIRRGSEFLQLPMRKELGCGGRFTVLYTGDLNARSDGRYVGVTQSMVEFAGSDDELAFVIAHEMAHNILHYRVKIKGSPRAPEISRSQTRRSRSSETEADLLAIELMYRAGFNIEAPEKILRRLPGGFLAALSFTHPSRSERIRMVRLATSGLTHPESAFGQSFKTALLEPGSDPRISRLSLPGSAGQDAPRTGSDRITAAKQPANP